MPEENRNSIFKSPEGQKLPTQNFILTKLSFKSDNKIRVSVFFLHKHRVLTKRAMKGKLHRWTEEASVRQKLTNSVGNNNKNVIQKKKNAKQQ